MHRRLSEGLLWLMYWVYKYKWCFIDIPHITAFHSCRILSKKLGGPLIISQAASWTIQHTRDHQRGCFDWQTDIRHIYDVLLESCISQLSIDFGYSTWSLVVLLSYHKQPHGPSMHWRSLDRLLWLIYWGSTYIQYDVLLEPCISQTARCSIQCTGDHCRCHFDWCTEVTHILYMVYC